MRQSSKPLPPIGFLVILASCLTLSCAPEPSTRPEAAPEEAPPAKPVAPPAAAPGPDVEERARAILKPLKQRLMAELTGAIADGPAAAIEVCRVRAPEIAAELAGEGIELGRTSHRLRNPRNAPRPWMEPLLAAYVAGPEDRVPHTVRIDEATFGYVEPIELKPMCLTCHGKELDATVQAKLDELYPDDRATGFEAGEFRGMFWVSLPAGSGEG